MKAFSRSIATALAMIVVMWAVPQVHAGEMGLKDTYAEAEPSIWGPGWMVRLRGLGVIPDEDSSNWVVGGAPSSGADVEIDASIVPEVDISYFFTKNWAVELILAVTPHDIDGKGSIAASGDVGDVWLLPPTLLLQYHFDMGNGIKPYVGAGVNYTVFFAEDAGPSYANLDLDNNFGWALQAGVDVQLQGNWFFNVDVKKLWLDTDASVTLLPSTPVTADVDIDPWIIGVGFGYKFGGPEPLPPLK